MRAKNLLLLLVIAGGMLAMSMNPGSAGMPASQGIEATIGSVGPVPFRAVDGVGIHVEFQEHPGGGGGVQTLELPKITLKRGLTSDGTFASLLDLVGEPVPRILIAIHGTDGRTEFAYEDCILWDVLLVDHASHGLGVEEEVRTECARLTISRHDSGKGEHGGGKSGGGA